MDELLQQGITAYKAGKRDEARELFISAVKQNPDNERAWGWMYQASNNDQERIHCLKQVLRINPKNEKAKQLLGTLAGNDFPFEMSKKTTAPTQEQKYSTPPDIRSNNKKTPKSVGIYSVIGIGAMLIIGICLASVWFVLQNQGTLNIPIAMPKPLSELQPEDLQKSTLTPSDLTFSGLYAPSEWQDCPVTEEQINNLRSESKVLNYDTNAKFVFKTFDLAASCNEFSKMSIVETIFLLTDKRNAQRVAENVKFNSMNWENLLSIPYKVTELSSDGYQFWILRGEAEWESSDIVVQVDEIVIEVSFVGTNKLVIDDILEVGVAAIKKIR